MNTHYEIMIMFLKQLPSKPTEMLLYFIIFPLTVSVRKLWCHLFHKKKKLHGYQGNKLKQTA